MQIPIIKPRSVLLILVLAMIVPPALAESQWQDPANRATLKNDALEATFQSGILVELRDLTRNKVLAHVEPSSVPEHYPVFGPPGIELSNATVKQTADEKSIRAILTTKDGNELTIAWSIEPGNGDLIAECSGQTSRPVDEMRMLVLGCDIQESSMVWVDGYGVGRPVHAPFQGEAAGNPLTGPCLENYLHPLVALFEGDRAGWWIEGREEKIGPSAMMILGQGSTTTLGFARRFPVPTTTPKLFSIHIRTWRAHWENAVDPYVDWMETGPGYVPIEKQKPEWVRDITNQGYIRIGDFDTLENLATKINPKHTLLGRMVGAWIHPMDYGYPDYTLNETAIKWIKRARELGFHVGVHFNTAGISKDRPELIERFKAGLLVTGKDANGKDTYQCVDGPHRHVYCSTALKAWRAYLIQQIKPAIDAGVDLVYLDESMAAMGNPYVDGMSAVDGVMTEEAEIKAAYPNVAIETEQFNPMNARRASFALSQMPLGHPLGGYIFHRFVNVVAEGVMGQPSDTHVWDAFASWGFMLPCADSKEDSWLQIAQAFQKYNLKPDSRLPRKEYLSFDSHPSLGLTPKDDPASPSDPTIFFSYRGDRGVTASFERAGKRRGLVIEEPGKEPRWVGTRIANVSQWSGPGVLRDFVPGSEAMVDWLVYSGNTQLALDPHQSYVLDETASLPQDRFHVTAVPDDFAFFQSSERRIESQYVGANTQWFKVNFSGHGPMTLSAPGKIRVYLDGAEVKVDRQTGTARINVDAAPDKPSTLLAYEPLENELEGRWVSLPWQTPREQRSWYVSRHIIEDVSPDGPVRMTRPGYGFWSHVGGTGMLQGAFPQAKKIRLQGGWGMREESQFDPGDAVIRINGKEVLRLLGGTRPYEVKAFDVDVTQYAGQPVFLEFTVEGTVHGAMMSDWFNPQIIAER